MINLSKYLVSGVLIISSLASFVSPVWAANGSGTNTVTPTSTTVSSTGNTHTFTYTASETMNSGGIRITVPSGWSTPQGTSGVNGYTTISSTGTAGVVLDSADSLTGWQNNTSNPTACSGSFAVDTGVVHEGTGSIRCASSGDKNNGVWYKNITAQNWSSYTTVGVWIRVVSGINNGDLQFAYDNNNALASPIATPSFGTAIPANTWTYVSFALSGTRTSIASFGFKIANCSALCNNTVYFDNIFLGGTSNIVPQFSGNTIIISAVSLTAGQTITVTYGAGGGTSGAVAPGTAGIYTFTTQSRTSDSGTFTNIASSPTVTVNNPVPTTTSISPSSKNVGDGTFTMTVNGTNFNSSSIVRFNGSNRTTTFVSSTQVTASIPSSDMTTAGTFNITVFNPTPGGGTSNAQTFTVNAAALGAPGIPDMTAGTDSGTSSTDNITNDTTPDFTISCVTGSTVQLFDNVTLIGSGTCVGSTVTITASTLSGGVHSSINAKQDGSAASGNLSITIDTTASTLAEVTPVPDPTTDTTPNYTFSSTESGTITYGGDCSSADTSASSGSNTITFNSLSVGTHSNCTITVTDTAGNISSVLNISSFTVNAANNPVPTTTNISPTSKTEGDAQFSLTVNGTNFISDSIVRFDGLNRTTTFVNSNQLTAIIPASDMTTAGTHTITVFNPTPGGGTSNGQTFTVNAPTIDHFVVTNTSNGNIADQTAGTPFNIKIVAKDAGNNTVTSFTGSVTLSNGLLGISPMTSDAFTAGVLASQSVTLTVAGTDSITATDSGETGTSNSFTVNAGAAAQFILDNPGDMIAGERLGYTVTRKDQFGNITTTGTSTVYLYTSSTGTFGKFFAASSGGSEIDFVTIASGQSTAQFWYEEGTAGNWSVTASDDNSAPDGSVGIDDASDDVVVSPGPTAKFILNDPGDMAVGTRVQYSVTRYDEFDNLVTSGTDTIYLYTNSTSPTAAFYNVSSGGSPTESIDISSGASSANFWYFDDLAGNWTVRASDNSSAPDGSVGINDGFDDVEVSTNPIIATKFIIENPTDAVAGDIVQVTVKAVDGSNALDTTYGSDVTLIVTGSALGGGVVDIVGGIGTMNITDEVAETVTLALSDTEGTGLDTSSTQDLVFSPGAVAQFTLDDPGNITAGSRIGYTVVRQDEFDNLVTSGISTVYLYTNSTGSLGLFYDASSGGSLISSATIAASQSSAQFWYQEGTAGSWTVTVSDNNSASDGSTGIEDASDPVVVSIVGGVATKIVIKNVSDVQVGTTFTVVITAEDSSNNTDTSYNNSVTLVASGNVSGAGVVTIVNGVGSIDLTADSVGSVTLSLSDTSPTGLNVSSTDSFNITTTPPPSGGGGDPVPEPTPALIVGFEGVGFPGGRLDVLSIPNGNISQAISVAQQDISTGGNFSLDITDERARSTIYVLKMFDQNGNLGRTRIFTNVIEGQAFENIFFAPTLALNRVAVRQGDLFIARGSAYSQAELELEIDNVLTGQKVTAATDGSYSMLVSSIGLNFGKHSLRVRQIFDGVTGEFSLSKAFNVSNIFRPIIDLNDDTVIDIRDINIFRTSWFSQNPEMNIRADLNNDNQVTLSDLSIFVQLLKRK